FVFFLMLHPPPKSTLFPYTTLFRSNKEGIGDTLLITLSIDEVVNKTFEKNGDVVRIINEDNNETVGFNIFNASTYFNVSNENGRSEEHTSELQSRENLVCRLLLEKK